ncbi:hypothetical protein JOC37_001600 [Desulfohalotomaculum tongense]|uniref:DUF5395 family protein n=1 Tax=Desulforadius tongensis TaxID=1216062 RepID=UPI001957B454|nr:DUF5395 family protein [Desulforadius tongensis]MBM7855215.1 hypothetical protein [Desulforadius tongensis]
MKADIELILTHDGKEWIARNEEFSVRGETLAEMEERLEKAVIERGTFNRGSKITVFMGFDFDTIPTWIRQYAAHYFNRYYSIEV